MSLAQIGENSVSLIIENKRYAIRELVIPNQILNNSELSGNQIVQAWKNYCLTIKNIKPKLSNLLGATFVIEIAIATNLIEIHYNTQVVKSGIQLDKGLCATAINLIIS